jgi:hypothetical protein
MLLPNRCRVEKFDLEVETSWEDLLQAPSIGDKPECWGLPNNEWINSSETSFAHANWYRRSVKSVD